ncbi:type I-B CRISPR-associated protein Cas8b1/Cst1 [Propionispira raffinosivorans]|uniref:type I-B CRISPR-associated protein Cas8b1/Cst1 n=1 Tax=Propionispira raffinosivorans TaxID=86959 RepID=UPI00036C8338|nr:type I-B CRISPR-associated protein Cas8b1/Cst1 [Propionispira raffinosivorans]
MVDEDFVKIEINAFLFNAGIVGFHYLLENMEAVKGEDYKVEENALFISKEFLEKSDLAQAYIDAHIQKFSEDATFTRICKEIESMESLTEKYVAEESKELKKILDDKYKYLLNNTGLARNSYFSACMSLAEQGYKIDLSALCKNIKEIKEYKEKYEQLCKLKEVLLEEKVKETFLMKDIIYARINSIWSNRAFLHQKKSKDNIYNVYEFDFVEPLQQYLKKEKTVKKTKTKNCIECNATIPSKLDFSMSFLNDTLDDLGKKKSSFWDCKPDAYICPLCAFVYSLAPLGFQILGRNLIFVNSNTSVEVLIGANKGIESKYKIKNANKENEKYQLILNNMVQGIIEEKAVEQQNIQVIVRDKATDRYKFTVIAKDILEVLTNCQKNLEKIKEISIEISPKVWISVYQEVLKNVFDRSNQYGLLNIILKNSLKENTSTIYLKNVVNIQIKMSGGTKMKKANADNAFYRGRDLRRLICGEKTKAQDADNKLRGFVYQLLNALQVNDREQFWNLVFRMYSSISVPVPQVFLETFSSEDELQYLGYAFVLGLKNEKYNSEDKVEEV